MNEIIVFIFAVLFYNVNFATSQSICGGLQEGRAYIISNSNFGCVLDILSGDKTPGAKIITFSNWFSTGATNQQWYIKKVNGTTDNYFILSVHDNQTLDTTGDVVTQQISTCSSTQQFAFSPASNGACYIYVNSLSSGMVLSNTGQTSDCKGTMPLAIKPKGTTTDQQWTFSEILTAQWHPVYPPCSLGLTTPPSTTTTTTTKATTTTGQGPTTTSNCISAKNADFSLNCSKPNSFYKDGICYTYYAENAFYEAQSACAAMGSTMALVRSGDIAEKMISVAKTANSSANVLWIQPPNNPLDYTNLSGLVSTDGQYSLMVNITNGICKNLNSNFTGGNRLWITDGQSCTTKYPYFCEKLTSFIQKDCNNQALARNTCVVSYSETKANINDCAIDCALTVWCTGVNYNQKSQICDILTDNTKSRQLTCELDWVYLERQ